MQDETFLVLSFRATIAYGLLALAGLLLAAIAAGNDTALFCALFAAGAAYLSQSFATMGVARLTCARLALGLQFASVALWLYGVHLVTGL